MKKHSDKIFPYRKLVLWTKNNKKFATELVFEENSILLECRVWSVDSDKNNYDKNYKINLWQKNCAKKICDKKYFVTKRKKQ